MHPLIMIKYLVSKKAISSGDYPLDLDKITDALMEAYNDIKS